MIYDIPVYYISFSKQHSLEQNLHDVGFNKIHHFKAIDGRKLCPDKLVSNEQISIRTYNDIKTGRRQHSGIPGMGAIGCTMSHAKLWKKCVDDNLDYIVIAEQDLKLNTISKSQLNKINKILQKQNSIFVSPLGKVEKNTITNFWGLHFYIASNGACRELIKNVYPIDVQTDAYISHLDTTRRIHVDGFKVGTQKKHVSDIQDMCIKCMLPHKTHRFVLIFILIIILLLLYKDLYAKKK